jgi:hypothetical protein
MWHVALPPHFWAPPMLVVRMFGVGLLIVCTGKFDSSLFVYLVLFGHHDSSRARMPLYRQIIISRANTHATHLSELFQKVTGIVRDHGGVVSLIFCCLNYLMPLSLCRLEELKTKVCNS